MITLPIENFRKTVWKIRLDWINDQKKKNIRFNSIKNFESRFNTFNRFQYKSKILQSATKQFNNSNKIPTPISILKHKIKQEGIYKTLCLDPYKFRKVSSLVGFRSYLLSPYSIGFFVWAVCNGDLS
ncbi:hypothetical protein CROQUDRAFT_654941 [Cronartium quercuum f. sp. fusiforme G11]|uniref:Uncharacterized protein n=1 Tax=Cronartium quercuum f. sp. fusiforme G11 TaxID=708437 RepID=A0A9P6TE66_9BASI|nr:hypothetical protein CROQUDRAFT_654941 [Cronartium quercuum f. sp. fusiforme G11]